MEEIKKQTANEISDEELNKVAGGMTYWYQRIASERNDPVEGHILQDGYLVIPDDMYEGSASSKWMTVKQFEAFKEEREIQGHTFYEGDANPQAQELKIS